MRLDRIIAVRNEKIVYHDGDKCIKVFRKGYSESDVLSQALNQTRIYEVGLNVPKILEISMIENKWALVSEYVEGRSLSRLMQEQPERTEEFVYLLAELQNMVQSQKCQLLNDMFIQLRRDILASRFDEGVCSAFSSRLLSISAVDCICHGDFIPSNIIISENGIPYIIDWSAVTCGDPNVDAARTYLHMLYRGNSQAADAYLDAYCDISSADPSVIRGWMPIVAVAHSVRTYGSERDFLTSFVHSSL